MKVTTLTIDLEDEIRKAGYVGVPIPVELLVQALESARREAFEFACTLCDVIADRHETMGQKDHAAGAMDVKAAILEKI